MKQTEDIYGETECEECGRDFETTFTYTSYILHDRLKREEHPDEDICEFCQGEETCEEKTCNKQAVILDKEGGVLYCASCYDTTVQGMDAEEIAEQEQFIHRLPDSLHERPRK